MRKATGLTISKKLLFLYRGKEDREMSRLPKVCLFLVVLIAGAMLLSSLALAGTTGRIKGRITDKATGEPIPGASVQLMGTRMGAMTDPDGSFMIVLVPPGKYSLQITSVSYSPMEIEGVEVVVDITTEQNAQMQTAVTDLDKVIRVTADRDKIDIYKVSSEVTMSKDQIKSMPVANVDQLLQQTAGVVTTSEGEIIIRGGRAGEVAYIVDGVTIGDPLGGYGPANLGLSLTSGSIQEISIIKDGFDPEYGNALSGIIRITTQTGSTENTNATLQYITDDFGNKSLNKYSENYDNLYFTISGPDPILKSRLLPALGLNMLEDKEVTYFFYAEMTKTNTSTNYKEFESPLYPKTYGSFNLFGIDVPERQSNDYTINANIMMKPINTMKMIFSYKNAVNRQTLFDWQYRYTPNTAPVGETKWQSYSMEVTHQINKDMHYYVKGSYYNRDVLYQPGDPNNPGKGLNPDQFLQYNLYESYQDRYAYVDQAGNIVFDNTIRNGQFDLPEPILDIYPDTVAGNFYGRDISGPYWTFGNIQGYGGMYDFRFNNIAFADNLEGEPFADLNGDGVWNPGDYLYDSNGNGKFDYDRRDVIDEHQAEPYLDGDVNLGERFIDVNNNGIYEPGLDIFISCDCPENMDIDRNGRYTGPNEAWSPGIEFIDRNGNGIFDYRNYQYDPGEPFTDINGNGIYDYGPGFLNVDSYDATTVWHHRRIQQYVMEGRMYRQMGNHEIKAGMEIRKEYMDKEDIRGLEIPYVGRDDGGAYPGIGELRDFYSYSPLAGTFYVRDNLEYGSMIASLGFRYDYFIQSSGLEEVAKADDLGTGVIYGDRTRFSPRIGFSYPISDKAKIHFNYGHFYQLPSYSFMYDRNTTSASANDIIGNYNLDYVKTIQYSFGVKYAMSEDYSVDLSGYFKDEFDKINSANVKIGGGALTVQRYENRDYGRSRGFEITIDKRGGRLINGEVNYTYAFAFGKQSQTRTTYWEDFQLSRESLAEKPLDNDVRHSLKCGIQLVIPETMKPRLFGFRIPNGWTFSVQGMFESGRPFTPGSNYPNLTTQEGVDVDENSLRRPSTLNFDVRFEKYFRLFALNWRGIVWVDNLLNTRNVVSVYGNTGRADTSQNDGSGNVTGGTEYDRNPELWRYGRQIKFGVQVSL